MSASQSVRLNQYISKELDRAGKISNPFVNQCSNDLEVHVTKVKGVPENVLCVGLHKPTGYVHTTTYPANNIEHAKTHNRVMFVRLVFEIASTR